MIPDELKNGGYPRIFINTIIPRNLYYRNVNIGIPPNYAQFDLSGQISLNGDATFWKDEIVGDFNYFNTGNVGVEVNHTYGTLSLKSNITSTEYAYGNIV